MTVRTAPHPHPFKNIDCYQPVVGGLRHLTEFPEKPADGTPVPFLCFNLGWVAGMRRRSKEMASCYSCKLEHEARQRPLD